MASKTDPRIDKRKVTMQTFNVVIDKDGKPVMVKAEAVDYVRPDQLDAYVADVSTRWQHVEVSEEPDAGPGGYDGDTADLTHLAEGKTLQQHLHETGVKDISDPTNGPNVGVAALPLRSN